MPVDGVVEREPGSGLPRSQPIDELFEAVLDDTGDATVRSLVSESWQRSLAAAIDPATPLPPLRFDPAESRARLDAHPLHKVMPLLRANLVSIAEEAKHVVVVTDGEGTVLWRDGATAVLGPADRVGLVEGSNWSEEAIGTNAMGTGLALGRPVQIHSTEHVVRAVHAWTCVAAPVMDPDSGRIIGAIDITGPRRTIHPAMLALVTATAQLAENQMRMQLAIADERLRARNQGHLASLRGTPGALVTPTGRIIAGDPFGDWPERVRLEAGRDRVLLADGREMHVEPLAEGFLLSATRRTASAAPAREHSLSLRFLGDGNPTVVLDGESHALTTRPAELLAALALNPDGLTAERLALLLYGDDGNQTTVRGEIHRLRALIGTDVLKTRPYRLAATVDADFDTVRGALREGRIADALRACPGPLLPRSDAPEIRGARDELEVGLRRAVLEAGRDRGDVELVHAFATHRMGRDDLEAHELLVDMLPAGDPRRAVAESRVARLLAE